MENVENGPQNGSPDAVIFWSSGSFFPCQTALGAQMAPKPPPRAPKASPSLDFYWFLVDFGWFFDDFLYHVGYFLSGLLHYFFGYLEVSFSNFWPQVQMCWGRPQGSVRSQKSAMWPTFCLACLFVFVTSSPTFQVSGHRIFGVASIVEILARAHTQNDALPHSPSLHVISKTSKAGLGSTTRQPQTSHRHTQTHCPPPYRQTPLESHIEK